MKKLKELLLPVLMLMASVQVFAQQENYDKEWLIGNYKNYRTTFTNAGPLITFWNPPQRLWNDQHSNICNGSGQLLLATDGGNIYDGNNAIIDNGDTILSDLAYEWIPGTLASQRTIILPLGGQYLLRF